MRELIERTAARLRQASTLAEKLSLAKTALAWAMDRFGRDFWLAWTGGKDSTLLVWLAREVCRERDWPLPRLLTIDEGDGFPELAAFQARLVRDWKLDCSVVANTALLGRHPTIGTYLPVAELGPSDRAALVRLGFTGPGFPFEPDSPIGCQLLKIEPLAEFVRRQAVAALAVGIRWDEHPARSREGLTRRLASPDHVRLHPLLPFRERDVWTAIRAFAIPFCELYRQGYRSLGCRSGSRPSAAIPAWEQDLDGTPERAGRAEAKEHVMARLRSLGYM